MIHNIKFEPYVRRIPTVMDRRTGIQLYDVDNLYPQKVEFIRDRSYTTKRCTEKIANFINGEGFQNQILASTIVNEKGENLNDILNKISSDYAIHKGFALYLTVNALGEFNGIKQFPFKYFRLGIPDEDGEVFEVKYNTNWERDFNRMVDRHEHIYSFPVFNQSKEIIKQQIEATGIQNYPGMIMYWTPQENEYPTCSFDAVLDHAQTQADIALFRLSSVQNNFSAGHIMFYPGTFETPEKEEEFKRKLNTVRGPTGPGIMVLEDPSGELKANDQIKPTQMQNVDRLHEFTSRDTKQSIRENFSLPPEILGEAPNSGMFNQQNMQDAYIYTNAQTRDDRDAISSAFKKIFSNWFQPVGEDFTITPQAYR